MESVAQTLLKNDDVLVLPLMKGETTLYDYLKEKISAVKMGITEKNTGNLRVVLPANPIEPLLNHNQSSYLDYVLGKIQKDTTVNSLHHNQSRYLDYVIGKIEKKSLGDIQADKSKLF